MRPVLRFVRDTLPGAKLKEQHHNTVQYQLPSECVQLGRVFGHIEAVRHQLNIEDYSVTQTSLDMVSGPQLGTAVLPIWGDFKKGLCGCNSIYHFSSAPLHLMRNCGQADRRGSANINLFT